MKKISTFLLLAISVFVLGTVSSCKDYDDDLYNDMKQMNADLKNVLTDDLNGKVAKLQAQLDALNAALNNIKQCTCDPNAVATLATKVSQLEQLLADLDTNYAGLSTTVGEQGDAISALQAALAGLQAKLDDYQTSVNNINGKIGDLEKLVNEPDYLKGLIEASLGITNLAGELTTITNDIAKLNKALEELGARVEANENAIIDINENLDEIAEWQSYINQVVVQIWEGIYETMGEIDNLRAEHQADVEDIMNYIEEVKADLDAVIAAAVEDLQGKIDALEAQHNADIEEMGDALVLATTALADALEALNEQVQNNTLRIDNLENALFALESWKSELITGITVQATESPILGNTIFSLPLGIQANALFGYYGETEFDGSFPVDCAAAEGSDPVLTEAECADITGGVYEYEAGALTNGNAGKLYFTINPSYIDYSGCDKSRDFKGLTLVNSQDKESAVSLRNVRKSDKVLTFGLSGLTRAADNGFYEADAVFETDEALYHPNLFAAAKDIAKTYKEGKGIKATLGAALSAAFNIAPLEAYALQAPYASSWKDENGDIAWGKYTAKYELAAGAVKPLSYNMNLEAFTGNLKFKKLSDFINLTEVLDHALGRIDFNINFGTFVTPASLKVNKVDISAGTVYVDYLLNVDGEYYTLSTTVNGIDEFLDELNNTVLGSLDGALSTDLEQAINDVLANTADQVNNTFESVIEVLTDYAKRGDKFISKIDNFLDKFYTRIKNANVYMKPVMFYQDAKGAYHTLSSSKKLPTYIKGSNMVLFPTSYFAETINPAFKKLVKVTKAYKNGVENTNVAGMVNGSKGSVNLNTVVDGETKLVAVEFEPGFTYEIAYAALDYSGYQCVQRYYVTVTE